MPTLGLMATIHYSVFFSLWLVFQFLSSLQFPMFSYDDSNKSLEETFEAGLRKFGGNGSCVTFFDNKPLALQSKGHVIIGGLFPLHYLAPEPQQGYDSKPQLTPCSGSVSG